MKDLRFALHSRSVTPILAYLSNINLTLYLLRNFACFFVASLLFFKINFFEKNISGIPSVCQTFWIQIRPDILSGVIWMQTVCKGYPQTTHKDKGLISANLKSLTDRHFRFFLALLLFLFVGTGMPFTTPVPTGMPFTTPGPMPTGTPFTTPGPMPTGMPSFTTPGSMPMGMPFSPPGFMPTGQAADQNKCQLGQVCLSSMAQS